MDKLQAVYELTARAIRRGDKTQMQDALTKLKLAIEPANQVHWGIYAAVINIVNFAYCSADNDAIHEYLTHTPEAMRIMHYLAKRTKIAKNPKEFFGLTGFCFSIGVENPKRDLILRNLRDFKLIETSQGEEYYWSRITELGLLQLDYLLPTWRTIKFSKI